MPMAETLQGAGQLQRTRTRPSPLRLKQAKGRGVLEGHVCLRLINVVQWEPNFRFRLADPGRIFEQLAAFH